MADLSVCVDSIRGENDRHVQRERMKCWLSMCFGSADYHQKRSSCPSTAECAHAHWSMGLIARCEHPLREPRAPTGTFPDLSKTRTGWTGLQYKDIGRTERKNQVSLAHQLYRSSSAMAFASLLSIVALATAASGKPYWSHRQSLFS